MGTKNNPGKFDCYQNAASDEPMFVLLARDEDAPIVIRIWAMVREARKRRQFIEMGNVPFPQAERDQLQEAIDCANAMERWFNR